VSFPKLFLWCGTEDGLLGANRKMHGLLEECRVAHRYMESEGNHSWRWWDKHICTALEYLLKEED
jgi:enterochelin esterase-like enzyme